LSRSRADEAEAAQAEYISSTAFLSMLAGYGAHLVERRPAASSCPEKALIIITSDSGRDLEIKSAGFWAALLQLPRAIFDAFVAASLIREDASASKLAAECFV
jgi:hypothetical protein